MTIINSSMIDTTDALRVELRDAHVFQHDIDEDSIC